MADGTPKRKRLRPRRPNRGAQLFTKWLLAKGLSRTAFAKAHKLSALTVSMWSNGRMVPGFRNAMWLQELCGIPMGAWFQPEKPERSGKAEARLATGTDC